MGGADGGLGLFTESLGFLQEMWPHAGPASEMHVGDLCWAVFRRSPPSFETLALWRDGRGRVQAFTKFDGSHVCDLVVRPGGAGLDAARRALDWAEGLCRRQAEHLRRPVSLRVGRRVDSSSVRSLLEVRGFVPLAAGFPAMRQSLAIHGVAVPELPAGYEVRALRDGDVDSRVEAFAGAFPGDTLDGGREILPVGGQ